MPHKNKELRKEYNKLYQQKNRERIYAKHKEWIAENKDKQKEYHKEYHKKWYEENIEERKKEIKEYSQNHKEDNVKRTQKYVSSHKEEVQKYNREFGQTIAGKYRLILYRAKKWGGQYLTIEEFAQLLPLPCVYCGDSDKPRGIDRVDNSKGYTKENSASCCRLCNFMKRAMTKENFLSHIKKIYNFNKL